MLSTAAVYKMLAEMRNEDYGILSSDDSLYYDKETKTRSSDSEPDSSDSESEGAAKKGGVA